MHIPDGFLSPQTYLPAAAFTVAGLAYALKGVKENLDEETLPFLAALTAFSFVLQSLALPIPGGTSVHLQGVALIAVFFGVRAAFVATSLVLLLQSLLFAQGGITAFFVSAPVIGLVGGGAARGLYLLLKRWGTFPALFAAGWAALNLSALVLALVLGLQPHIAVSPTGEPLFFPFGWEVVVPAMTVPHLFVGLAEGAATAVVGRLLIRRYGESLGR